MRRHLQLIRERFHPLFYARRSSLGRKIIHLLDRPVWMHLQGVEFKVRGRMISHGLAFAIVGSQEKNPESLALACIYRLGLRSFWDVGANIGYYSWVLRAAAPHLKIVLFEPFPPNADLIRATINRNKFKQVTLISAGASDATGMKTLRTNAEAGATSSFETETMTFEERHWGVRAGFVKIPVVTIDDQSSRYEPVDFIKIDVEGHEQSVLRGALKTISFSQPVLFIECDHPGHPCLAPLQQLGYRFVDADRLISGLRADTVNLFAFPERFASSIDTLLEIALQHRRHKRV